jgi:hypothetical protein
MADLVVELYGTRVGVLSGTWRTFDFLPAPAAVARSGIDSPILSVAILPRGSVSNTDSSLVMPVASLWYLGAGPGHARRFATVKVALHRF